MSNRWGREWGFQGQVRRRCSGKMYPQATQPEIEGWHRSNIDKEPLRRKKP
jgi:hypothetical protein